MMFPSHRTTVRLHKWVLIFGFWTCRTEYLFTALSQLQTHRTHRSASLNMDDVPVESKFSPGAAKNGYQPLFEITVKTLDRQTLSKAQISTYLDWILPRQN